MRKGTALRLLACVGALAAAVALAPLARAGAAVPAGRIDGSVVLLRAQGETVPGGDAVVWLVGSPVPPASSVAIDMASQDKSFAPRVVAVPLGGSVRFPNRDRIYHNVFSRTLGQEFDLGLYKGGEAKERRFDRPGAVQVYCNIHAQMAAHVLVVDGGISTTTGSDGRFRLEGVAPGAHYLKVWHEMGGEQELSVSVRANETSSIEVRLDASRWRPAEHKNKHGEDYPPASLDDDRY